VLERNSGPVWEREGARINLYRILLALLSRFLTDREGKEETCRRYYQGDRSVRSVGETSFLFSSPETDPREFLYANYSDFRPSLRTRPPRTDRATWRV